MPRIPAANEGFPMSMLIPLTTIWLAGSLILVVAGLVAVTAED
jgi:hypothetical protein